MDHGADIISLAGELLSTGDVESRRTAITCTVEHALLPEHLANYADEHGKLTSAQKADEKDLNVLRSKHHGVARLLAEGIPEGVVADMCGYTASHLSVLKSSPAMVELIQFYRGPKNEQAKVIGNRLRTVADMSLELLEKRLEEKGDEVSVSELAAVAKLGADRSGHGPQSTVNQVTEHHIVAPEQILELSRSARQRDKARIVEVSAVRSVLPTRGAEDGTTEARDGSSHPLLPGPDGSGS